MALPWPRYWWKEEGPSGPPGYQSLTAMERSARDVQALEGWQHWHAPRFVSSGSPAVLMGSRVTNPGPRGHGLTPWLRVEASAALGTSRHLHCCGRVCASRPAIASTRFHLAARIRTRVPRVDPTRQRSKPSSDMRMLIIRWSMAAWTVWW